MMRVLGEYNNVEVREQRVTYRWGKKMIVKEDEDEKSIKVSIIEFRGDERPIANRVDFSIPMEFEESLANTLLEHVKSKKEVVNDSRDA